MHFLMKYQRIWWWCARNNVVLLDFVADLMSAQPDITKTVVVTIANQNALDTPNNNHIGSMEKVPIFSDNAINRALEGEPHTPVKNSQNNLSRKDSKASLKSSDCESRPNSMYSERTNRHSVISSQLPPNIDMEALVWANVTHTGGRITLPDSGKWLPLPTLLPHTTLPSVTLTNSLFYSYIICMCLSRLNHHLLFIITLPRTRAMCDQRTLNLVCSASSIEVTSASLPM